MKIHFITYGNDKFKNSRNRIVQEAINFGFDSCKAYSPDDLDLEFKTKFSDILKQPRIAGYGIWRPYIIKKSLETIENGDYLLYLDAGCTINPAGKQRFIEYLNMLNGENQILSIQMAHVEQHYTTKEIFTYFNCLDNEAITKSGQYLDGIILIKKGAHSEKLIDIWLKVVYDNPLLFTDCYNNIQESFFVDNRHEQSVFSVLRKIYGSAIVPTDETFVLPWGSPESCVYPFWATRIHG